MTVTDEDLIGYVLDLLDPAERASVAAHLAADPAEFARADRLRASFAPLAADRSPDAPPPGLAVGAIALVAEHLVATSPRSVPEHSSAADVVTAVFGTTKRRKIGPPIDRPESRGVSGRFRGELVVAASIGLLAVGFVFSAVSRLRHDSQVVACQNNLRTLHQGLVGYSDRHHGEFPQIGGEHYPTAETFVLALFREGELQPTFRATCPADGDHDPRTSPSAGVRYTYTLGHRTPAGGVLGLRRSDAPADEHDLVPISADYPIPGACPGTGPTSLHARGNNVLYVGGHVRFATTAAVGVNGDQIYCNRAGRVAAGLDREDAVLGRAGDRP